MRWHDATMLAVAMTAADAVGHARDLLAQDLLLNPQIVAVAIEPRPVGGPRVRINGRGFGTTPPPVVGQPTGGTSGYLYGYRLLFENREATHPYTFSAGGGTDADDERDDVGIENLRYSDSEISFTLGSGYQEGRHVLLDTDPFTVRVGAATYQDRANYRCKVPDGAAIQPPRFSEAHPRQHCYTLIHGICSVDEAPTTCTLDRVARAMLRYPAPRLRCMSPVADGMVEELTGLGLYFPGARQPNYVLVRRNFVKYTVRRGGLEILNSTVARRHVFDPGWVHRMVVRSGSDLYVVTTGSGTGEYLTENVDGGRQIFTALDSYIAASVATPGDVFYSPQVVMSDITKALVRPLTFCRVP
jgi:hypothetical protein